MKRVPAALLLGLTACQLPADGPDVAAKLQKSDADGDAATLNLDVAIGCAGDIYPDYDDGCQTLILDASATTTSNGDIVSWSWELDGSTYSTAEVIRAFVLDPTDTASGELAPSALLLPRLSLRSLRSRSSYGSGLRPADSARFRMR